MSAKNSKIKKWLLHHVAHNPPRAKSIVMTLFGDAITPHGGEVWLGSLIEFLALLGINERLVRTSVFRLTEEGWLEARREGRRSQYALNATAAKRFERAHQRIYTPVYRPWDGKWTLLLATSPIINAEQRARLRKELLWQGFGVITTSVYARPNSDTALLDELIADVGVRDNVFVCQASESELRSARPFRDIVDQTWELSAVIRDYEYFIHSFSSLLKLVTSQTSLEPADAFALRILLVHGFRRVQLHDPLLPLELLPTGWPGKLAYELCHDIYQATYKPAEEYIVATLLKEDENAGEAAPYFSHRFGGLA